MPMPIISVPKFPDVPQLPGVPAVVRSAAPIINAIGYIEHIDNIVERLIGGSTTEVWGVFDATGGTEVVSADTFFGMSFKNGFSLMSYPIEKGSFESYNKVANPFEVSVTVATGGTLEDRKAMLAAIDKVAGSLDLYTVITPEKSYSSVNLASYDYRREQANGSHMLMVTMHFTEIRETANINGSGELSPADVQDPSTASNQSLGQVTASKISTIQQAAITGAAKGLASVQAAVSGAVTKTQLAIEGIVQ